jgi:NTP pyrophosphatase (non-canonical NTP hydrolase)
MSYQDIHTQMVARLTKPGEDILKTLTASTTNLWHLATGVAGEAGELLDAIKKAAIYNKPLDVENVLEEMGDLEFYLEGLRQALGVEREHVLHANYRKLAVRYQGLIYSDQAAQQRADKIDSDKFTIDEVNNGTA